METPGSVFRLDGFAQVTQPLVGLHILFFQAFFSMTVFKREIISQSVLAWLKILVHVTFFFRNIRNAVSILAVLQAGNFLYPATWMKI